MDNIDKVMWVLPFLGFLDVASSLYVERQGYPLAIYEAGPLASYFASIGLIYLYIPVYLLILVGFSYVLRFIKKRLRPSLSFDRIVFVLLVAVVCFVYIRLTVTFITNFLFPQTMQGKIPIDGVTWLIYLSTFLGLGLYLWRDVIAWVRPVDEKKQQRNTEPF